MREVSKDGEEMSNPRHSSATTEYYTPPEIVKAARELMGAIDMDPATTAIANREIVRASSFYTVEDNGFMRPWRANRVFLNPPGGLCGPDGLAVPKRRAGSRSSAVAWWEKLMSEWQADRVKEAVFIGFSLELLQTAQATLISPLHFPICYPAKRIAFYTQVGEVLKPGTRPTHANFICYIPRAQTTAKLDAAHERFKRLFGVFGHVVVPAKTGQFKLLA